MKILTKNSGEMEIEEERIISMPEGMLGFGEKKRYVLIQEKETAPFLSYQSVDDPALSFVVIDPHLFKPDYQVALDDTVHRMSWDGEKESLICLVVVTIPQGRPEKMTANLLGPMVINERRKEAVQLILQNSPYSHQHPLFEQGT